MVPFRVIFSFLQLHWHWLIKYPVVVSLGDLWQYRIAVLFRLMPWNICVLSKGIECRRGSSWEKIEKKNICFWVVYCMLFPAFLLSILPRLQSWHPSCFSYLQEKFGASPPITSWTSFPESWPIWGTTTSWTMTSFCSGAASSGTQTGVTVWWFILVCFLQLEPDPACESLLTTQLWFGSNIQTRIRREA